MKFDVDDKNRYRLVCVKFHLNRCRFAVAVAKCLGVHFFGHSVVAYCCCAQKSRPSGANQTTRIQQRVQTTTETEVSGPLVKVCIRLSEKTMSFCRIAKLEKNSTYTHRINE